MCLREEGADLIIHPHELKAGAICFNSFFDPDQAGQPLAVDIGEHSKIQDQCLTALRKLHICIILNQSNLFCLEPWRHLNRHFRVRQSIHPQA